MNKPRIRCAIYTRKSTEEGLEQGFNSLDAQREACEAYVASQRHEGWVLDKTRYDDGGLSGGTLDRAAMQQLLHDIDIGRIQMVVVYKIDRLTRSLADFAKLVERFDAVGCSFVSVTQAFNTASSMGRLTLNVLLSFAQFEREVTAERIRDKIAASKKRGLWMGGMPPLGYDSHPDQKIRGLIVNAQEAATVREVFALYERFGCLSAVKREAEHRQLRSKRHRFKSGRCQGGNALSRGQIYAILRNPIYIGMIRHKDKVWDGQHEGIIARTQWDTVQKRLQEASARPRSRGAEANGAKRTTPVLTGKLTDETGDKLTPTHTKRHGRRFAYYVSNRLISGGTDTSGWRLPASALEVAISSVIAQHLIQLGTVHNLTTTPDVTSAAQIARKTQAVSQQLTGGDQPLLRELLLSGRISKGCMALQLNAEVLATRLGVQVHEISHNALNINSPFALRRRGVEAKLVAGEHIPDPNQTLIRALALAHRATTALREGIPLRQISAKEKCSDSYIRTRSQLAFLAPKIQRAILAGQQPLELTLEKIIRKPIPLDWDQQLATFGFDAR